MDFSTEAICVYSFSAGRTRIVAHKLGWWIFDETPALPRLKGSIKDRQNHRLVYSVVPGSLPNETDPLEAPVARKREQIRGFRPKPFLSSLFTSGYAASSPSTLKYGFPGVRRLLYRVLV